MAGWALSLGRIGGTEVRIHFTFLLLLLWLGVSAAMQGGAPAAFDAIAFLLAIFLCVVLHEYGHVLMAKRFGIATRDITLLPIGGVATIERMPENPGQELLVALAGPAVNLVIAVALIGLFGVTSDPGVVAESLHKPDIDLVTRLAFANLMLAVFNLIPAFPMDGGRVLRALLCLRMDRASATRVAARVGRGIALVLGILGLLGNPILLLIAIFIFLGATYEGQAAELGEATKGAAALQATITQFATLDMESTVAHAVELLLATEQREFPVIDGQGRLCGILTRDGMIRALATLGPQTPVADVMERDVPTVAPRASLSDALAELQRSGQPVLGVVDADGRVVGMITREHLAEYLMVTEANRERQRRERAQFDLHQRPTEGAR
jgi:stage IV sporulation protein FB